MNRSYDVFPVFTRCSAGLAAPYLSSWIQSSDFQPSVHPRDDLFCLCDPDEPLGFRIPALIVRSKRCCHRLQIWFFHEEFCQMLKTQTGWKSVLKPHVHHRKLFESMWWETAGRVLFHPRGGTVSVVSKPQLFIWPYRLQVINKTTC